MSNKSDKKENLEEDIVFEEDIDHSSGDLNVLLKKMKDLKEKLRKSEDEKKEYLDGWQRARADFANAKKKHEEKRGELVVAGKEEAVEKILPVADSFEMAFRGSGWENVDENWKKGVEYIYSQYKGALRDLGVEEVDPLGEAFNPSMHTSVESVETNDEDKDNLIAEVVQKGYQMGDRVLRSPRVKVFHYK